MQIIITCIVDQINGARRPVRMIEPFAVGGLIHGAGPEQVHALVSPEHLARRKRNFYSKLGLHLKSLPVVRRNKLRAIRLFELPVLDGNVIAVIIKKPARLRGGECIASHKRKQNKSKQKWLHIRMPLELRKLLGHNGPDDLRIGLALGELHDLPHEESCGRLLAILEILNGAWVRRNRLIHKAF